MMERHLTVKGIGSLSVKPDLTIITMELATLTPKYAQTMEKAAAEIETLRQAIASIGFERESIKTTNFTVNAEHENIRGNDGNYRRQFKGHKCSHSLKLEFDFDMKRLGKTIAAISDCGVAVEFQIRFSVKDKAAVSAELLESAIANAKEKAIILAKSAGVELGEIQRIDYSWGELHLYSDTRFQDDGMMLQEAVVASAIDIEPDDVNVGDSVTVVWAIG